MFRLRKEEAKPAPKCRAAVCYTDPGETRRTIDWLLRLRVCEPIAILSDAPDDVLWVCLRERPDILLLEAMPDAMERLDEPSKDITGRCELSVRVRERLPDCRVYLICGAQFGSLKPVLDKAVETGLIDGYRIGQLTRLHVESWIADAGCPIGGDSAVKGEFP